MSRIIVLSLLSLMPFLSMSQVLVSDLMGVEDRVVFNKSFVKENYIKSIVIKEQVKKRGQTILDLNKSSRMFYDQNGEIISKSEIGRADTTWSELMKYVFENDKKISEFSSTQGGCSITNFSYNDYNQLVEIVSGKSTQDLDEYRSDSFTKIGIQKLEWKELDSGIIQKKILNNLGKPYMEVNYRFDSTGVFLMEIKETFIISKRSNITSFEYDEKGRLKLEKRDRTIVTYYYDENDNFLNEIHYENGEETQRIEYVYNASGLLSAALLKYSYSPTVYINKYSYEYW